MPTKATRLNRNKRHKTGHPGQLRPLNRTPARTSHQDKKLDRQETRAKAKFPKPGDRLSFAILRGIWTNQDGFRVGWKASRRWAFLQDAVVDNPHLQQKQPTQPQSAAGVTVVPDKKQRRSQSNRRSG